MSSIRNVTENSLRGTSVQFMDEKSRVAGMDIKTKSKHSNVVNCILVFCMASGILTTSIIIHLSIENYHRLQEYRELRSEIEILNWKMKFEGNFTWRDPIAESVKQIKGSKLQRDVINDRNPSGRKNIATNYPGKQNQAKSKSDSDRKNTNSDPTTSSALRVLPTARPEPLSLFNTEASLANLNAQMRHCLVRVREVEHDQRELEGSHDFLRQQMHQRLVAIENLLGDNSNQKDKFPAFFVYFTHNVRFSRQNHLEGRTSVLRFDRELLNENKGYTLDIGEFKCSFDGFYAFHLSLLVTSPVYEENYYSPLYENVSISRCVVSIRRNRFELIQGSSTVRPVTDTYIGEEYTGYDNVELLNSGYITLTLATRLVENDIIDVLIQENPDCVVIGRKSSILSSFQGYFVHN